MRPSNALVNAPSEILVQHDKQLIFCLTGVSCFKSYMHTSWSGIQKLHCQFISKSNFRRLFQIRFLKFNMLSMVNKSPIGNKNNHQLKKKEIRAQIFFRVLTRLCKEPFHILLGISKATFTQIWEKSIKYNKKGYLKNFFFSCYKAHGVSEKSIGKNILFLSYLDCEIDKWWCIWMMSTLIMVFFVDRHFAGLSSVKHQTYTN